MRFLPWHLNFFCRYVPLPEEEYGEPARRHPLLQSRLLAPPPASTLERLLGDARPDTHRRLADELLASSTLEEARERAERLAALPAPGRGGRRAARRRLRGGRLRKGVRAPQSTYRWRVRTVPRRPARARRTRCSPREPSGGSNVRR